MAPSFSTKLACELPSFTSQIPSPAALSTTQYRTLIDIRASPIGHLSRSTFFGAKERFAWVFWDLKHLRHGILLRTSHIMFACVQFRSSILVGLGILSHHQHHQSGLCLVKAPQYLKAHCFSSLFSGF